MSPFTRDATNTIVFGTASLALGLLYDLEDGVNDFRELPLLILILYLRNPAFILGACALTAIATPTWESYPTAFFMHLTAMSAAFLGYRFIKKSKYGSLFRGICWVFFVVVYYTVFLIPTWIITDYLVGITSDLTLFYEFKEIFRSNKYEMISSSLITGFYLIQIESRKRLKQRKFELEKRSQDLQNSLDVLKKYAQLNSHEVRGPLAKILGLIDAIEYESDEKSQQELISMLKSSGLELDRVIREMNDVLTSNSES